MFSTSTKMNCKGHQTSFTIPPLRYIALRGFVLSLYESTARWRKAKDIKQDGFDCIKRLKVALHVKKQVLSAFNGILLEVERWGKVTAVTIYLLLHNCLLLLFR